MNFYQVLPVDNWYFKIKLPHADVRRLSYSQKVLKYLYAIKKYVNSFETQYLYQEEIDDGVYLFQIGYAMFIYNEFYQDLDEQSRSILENIITNNEFTFKRFDNLRDDQNDDLEQLLNWNRGIFQTYTSYGKTEVIGTLE